MAESPSSPELVNAYHLLKAGQRPEAGRILKSYLAQNPKDAKGWWLMAHAISEPDQVRRCLETVLQLDPTHTKARARLNELLAPPVPDDEPDDSFFLGAISSRPATIQPIHLEADSTPPPPTPSAPAPPTLSRSKLPPAKPREEPAFSAPPSTSTDGTPSFEDFLRADPFAAPSHDDPFEGIPDGSGGGPSVRSFVRSAIGDSGGTAEVSGASAFTPEGSVDDERHSVERLIGFGLVAIAIVVVVALVLFLAENQGWIGSKGGGGVPSMTTLDGASFSVDYPQGWDMRCEHESMGYSVCGIANHAFYNEVDSFVGKQVDIGQMLSQSFSMMFSGDSLPDTDVSIIVMDVPPTSASYDNGSWAKTQYELYQDGWTFDDSAKVNYVQDQRQIGDYPAYYYEYTSKGRWVTAAWDIYIPHDGLTLWLRATFFADKGKTIPQDMIEAMIDSIAVKPVEDWTSS